MSKKEHVGLVYKTARNVLYQQFHKTYKQRSRNEFKKHHGNHADYWHVYTYTSYRQHLSAMKQFSKWCVNEKGIWKIAGINHHLVGEYCNAMRQQGYSAWTIKARITAINHVMIGSNHWTSEEAFSATAWNKAHHDYYGTGLTQIHRKVQAEIINNREETAQQWRKSHVRVYAANQQVIDTARAFGLRRGELIHTIKDKPAVIKQSFFKDNDGKLYAFVPYGKGGRPRFAQCRQDMQAEMEQYYQPLKINSVSHDMKTIYEFRDNWLAYHQRELRQQQYLFTKYDHRVSFHRQRQEYAQVRLAEEQQISPLVHDYQQTIGGVTAYHSQFARVSQDLGHNRVDVLANYLSNQ